LVSRQLRTEGAGENTSPLAGIFGRGVFEDVLRRFDALISRIAQGDGNADPQLRG
jgi:hypothetical protein